MGERVKLAFCFLVGAGWLANLVAGIAVKGYHPDLIVNGPMMLVLGAVFATRKKKERTNDAT